MGSDPPQFSVIAAGSFFLTERHGTIRLVAAAFCAPIFQSSLSESRGLSQLQAEAFLQYTAAEQLSCSTILRDHDGKFSADFDRMFTERAIKVKPVGPRAPNLNAFVERWIQSLKHEALNHFIVFGLAHFDFIVSEFVAYYHECRPHQGIGNRLIGAEEDAEPPAVVSLDEVKCESRLGGLLKHYYRAA